MTLKAIETFHTPDDCAPNDLIESIQIVSDVPFTLDWARGTNEKVKLVRLTRIAETDAPGTQIHQNTSWL